MAGAVLAVLLALPVGIMAARYRTRSVRTIETVSYTGHALPGVVVGLSLVFLTLAVLPIAYQTVVILAFAYAVLFLPKAIGATRSATASVSPVLEQTARTLGRGPYVRGQVRVVHVLVQVRVLVRVQGGHGAVVTAGGGRGVGCVRVGA